MSGLCAALQADLSETRGIRPFNTYLPKNVLDSHH